MGRFVQPDQGEKLWAEEMYVLVFADRAECFVFPSIRFVRCC